MVSFLHSWVVGLELGWVSGGTEAQYAGQDPVQVWEQPQELSGPFTEGGVSNPDTWPLGGWARLYGTSVTCARFGLRFLANPTFPSFKEGRVP